MSRRPTPAGAIRDAIIESLRHGPRDEQRQWADDLREAASLIVSLTDTANQQAGSNSESMVDAIAAGDGTLHGAIDYWQERAAQAEAALAEARRQALEDAAKVCESTDLCGDPFDGWLEIIGKRIRALQDQAPQPAEPTEAQIEAAARRMCQMKADALPAITFAYLWSHAKTGFIEEAREVLRAAFAAKENE